ncbi:MAG: nickel-dependent lactate racemase [Ardenticatenaceae bacterium]|nr:nickel-dependent lactate racemase [Ardenticatenaceae bacterium]
MKLRWQAWYGDHEIDLDFPVEWQVERVGMVDAPAADLETLAQSLSNPIGAPSLRELAGTSKRAVIVVEDITRPSQMSMIIPLILAELEAGGIGPEATTFVIGLGAHTPMRRSELVMKLGEPIVRNYAIFQNQPHENREYLGETRRGTPIYINCFYLQADLRISVGSIVPHGLAGFAGGVKTVAVGMAGIETLHANHARTRTAPGPMAGRIVGNDCRDDLEEIGRVVGLQFIVNTVVNSQREFVALFAGDPIEAHRAGVRFARHVYATRLPPLADIAVFNAYPKDSDLVQLINSMNAVGRDLRRAIKPDGSAVLMTACSHGAGIHYLSSVGMRGYGPVSREKLGIRERGLIIFSPNLSRSDISNYPADTCLYNEWPEVIGELQRRHGDRATVSVFPNAALQLPDSIATLDAQASGAEAF